MKGIKKLGRALSTAEFEWIYHGLGQHCEIIVSYNGCLCFDFLLKLRLLDRKFTIGTLFAVWSFYLGEKFASVCFVNPMVMRGYMENLLQVDHSSVTRPNHL